MAKNSDYSLADLQRMLSSRKTELDSLKRQRVKAEKDLAAIDSRIAVLEGRKKGRGGRVRRMKRPRNKISLHKTVLEILGKNKDGLQLDDLKQKILASGYKTTSQNFRNVIYQTSYHSKQIMQDKKTRKYKLKATK